MSTKGKNTNRYFNTSMKNGFLKASLLTVIFGEYFKR